MQVSSLLVCPGVTTAQHSVRGRLLNICTPTDVSFMGTDEPVHSCAISST